MDGQVIVCAESSAPWEVAEIAAYVRLIDVIVCLIDVIVCLG